MEADWVILALGAEPEPDPESWVGDFGSLDGGRSVRAVTVDALADDVADRVFLPEATRSGAVRGGGGDPGRASGPIRGGRVLRRNGDSRRRDPASLPPFLGAIQPLKRDEFDQKRQAVDLAFLRQGITFNVYGDQAGAERIFPFDLIPRIIPASEWQRVEAGLVQRITRSTTSCTTSTTSNGS
jgi:hypothetical protein